VWQVKTDDSGKLSFAMSVFLSMDYPLWSVYIETPRTWNLVMAWATGVTGTPFLNFSSYLTFEQLPKFNVKRYVHCKMSNSSKN